MIPIKSSKWETLQYWIFEREAIRLGKEAGLPKPWTEDKTLQNYKFCNVHRRDDKVSKWIEENWIAPNLGHPNLVEAMAIARMVNWPDTLKVLGFPEDGWDKFYRNHFLNCISRRRKLKLKSWTGAYMITAEHDGTPKEESVAKSIDVIAQGNFPLETLQQTWEELQKAPRVGSFIAAQIVADLKWGPLLHAPDWNTFCAPGPGSTTGLNWLTDQPLNKVYGQEDFMTIINELRARHNNVLIPGQEGLVTDAQDFQNCLCELHKYVRGYSRTKYNGAV